jgi:hypothetical protein
MGDAVAGVPLDTLRDHIAQALAIAVKAYNLPKVELTRFGGHVSLCEGGVHHAEIKAPIPG